MCVCSAVKSVIVCQVLPSVAKCCHSVAMVLPWWFIVDTIPSSVCVLKWWLAVGDGVVGSWLLAQIQPIRLLHFPMDHHPQSNTICFNERVIKSRQIGDRSCLHLCMQTLNRMLIGMSPMVTVIHEKHNWAIQSLTTEAWYCVHVHVCLVRVALHVSDNSCLCSSVCIEFQCVKL